MPMADVTKLRLLAVLAHPDDETFGCGGTLAKYADQGAQVTLICATRGEVGEISDPALATRENLGQVREQELRDACDVLGIDDLRMLGYRDSGMADTQENLHPESLCQASLHEVVGRVVEIIRRKKPHVVLTFDPNGGYGHPDHMLIHQATREAFSTASDADSFREQIADGLDTHKPRKLYYMAFPRSMTTAFRQAMIDAEVQSDFTEIDPETMGVPDDQITTVVDVSQYSKHKEQAALCHRTQIQGDDPFSWIPEAVRTLFLSTEHLVRAEPPFASPYDKTEQDITWKLRIRSPGRNQCG